MLPDSSTGDPYTPLIESQCTYRCVVLPDAYLPNGPRRDILSQCTYRCVVLPDLPFYLSENVISEVSMHLQVRGAP